MRPGQLTPENEGEVKVLFQKSGEASMRPGQLTPENRNFDDEDEAKDELLQ